MADQGGPSTPPPAPKAPKADAKGGGIKELLNRRLLGLPGWTWAVGVGVAGGLLYFHFSKSSSSSGATAGTAGASGAGVSNMTPQSAADFLGSQGYWVTAGGIPGAGIPPPGPTPPPSTQGTSGSGDQDQRKGPCAQGVPRNPDGSCPPISDIFPGTGPSPLPPPTGSSPTGPGVSSYQSRPFGVFSGNKGAMTWDTTHPGIPLRSGPEGNAPVLSIVPWNTALGTPISISNAPSPVAGVSPDAWGQFQDPNSGNQGWIWMGDVMKQAGAAVGGALIAPFMGLADLSGRPVISGR